MHANAHPRRYGHQQVIARTSSAWVIMQIGCWHLRSKLSHRGQMRSRFVGGFAGGVTPKHNDWQHGTCKEQSQYAWRTPPPTAIALSECVHAMNLLEECAECSFGRRPEQHHQHPDGKEERCRPRAAIGKNNGDWTLCTPRVGAQIQAVNHHEYQRSE